MPRNTTRYYPQTTLYTGLTLNLVCHRPARGERILLITNRTDLQQVLAVYGQRWAIETTFACLKSRGFNLEDTHMCKALELLDTVFGFIQPLLRFGRIVFPVVLGLGFYSRGVAGSTADCSAA